MPESRKRPAPKKAVPTPKKVAPTTVTSADEWAAGAEGQILELPSGKSARVRMPGLQAFIAADLIPNELLPIVMGRATGESMQDEELAKLRQDPAMLLQLALTMDKIFAYCVTEPKFEPAPTRQLEDGRTVLAPEAKEDGVLYTDVVSDEDKGYVFNVAVGGTRDLERFRAEQSAQLAAVQAG